MTHEKKWVFTELVKDADNIEQLVSYAVYKTFKDERAQSVRKSGGTEAEIEHALVEYHEQCLKSPKQLEVFRTTAREILNSYVLNVNKDLTDKLLAEFLKQLNEKDREIKKINEQFKGAQDKALKKLIAGAKEYSKKLDEPTGKIAVTKKWLWTFVKFLFSGVPKFIATSVSIAILVAIITFISGDANNIVRNGLIKLVDLVAPAASTSSEQTQNHSKPLTSTGKNG